MSEIIDRQTLVSAIESYSHRSDLGPGGKDVIDIFISAGESRINRFLRCREMETKVTTTTSSSFNSLPSDFIKFNSFQLGDRVPVNLVTSTQQDYDRNSKEITISIANGQFEIRPTVVDEIDLEYSYFSKVSALVFPSDSNSVLLAFPMIYLYSCMMDVAMFTQDDSRIATWEAAFTKEVQLINDDAQQAKYSGAPLSVRGN